MVISYVVLGLLIFGGGYLAAVLGKFSAKREQTTNLLKALVVNYEYLNSIHILAMADYGRWDMMKKQAAKLLQLNDLAKKTPGFPVLSYECERANKDVIQLIDKHEMELLSKATPKSKKPMPSYLQLVKNDRPN